VFAPETSRLFRDGKAEAIGQKGARILAAVLARRGDVLTKTELVDAAWPGTAVEESNLSVQVEAYDRAVTSSWNCTS
jgi:DNA-binding winged helix-turn-helix (wHTH) protein